MWPTSSFSKLPMSPSQLTLLSSSCCCCSLMDRDVSSFCAWMTPLRRVSAVPSTAFQGHAQREPWDSGTAPNQQYVCSAVMEAEGVKLVL